MKLSIPLATIAVLFLVSLPAYAGIVTFEFGGVFGPFGLGIDPSLAPVLGFGDGTRFTGTFSYDSNGTSSTNVASMRWEINGNVFESTPGELNQAWVESNDHHDGFRLRAHNPTLPFGWTASGNAMQLNIIFNHINFPPYSEGPPPNRWLTLPDTLNLDDFTTHERIVEFFIQGYGDASLSTPLGTYAPYSNIIVLGYIDTLILVPERPTLICEGFLAPFDRELTLKKKDNRAIPVKMVLTDVLGDLITDTDLSAAPVVQVTFGGASVPFDGYAADLVPAGLSDDGNQFRYDPAAMRWIINLATKQFTAPGVYTVTVKPGDDSYLIDGCSQTFVRP